MFVKDLAKLKSDTTVSSGHDKDLEERYILIEIVTKSCKVFDILGLFDQDN